jgi:very-short-patch-repair endonuclease
VYVCGVNEKGLDNKSKISINCICGKLFLISFKQLKHNKKINRSNICRSCSIKKLWENPDYRIRVNDSLKSLDKTLLKQKISKKSKLMWENSEYRENQKNIHTSSDYIKETSERSKKLWDNDDFRTNQLKIRNDPIWIEKQSKSMKKLWENSDYQNRVSSSLSKVFIKGYKSSLEIVTHNILESMHVRFEEQKPLGPYIFDFFLPEHDTFIECQGEYWHSIKKASSKDASKFSYFEKSRPNSKILYLHERDFLNPKIVEKKIEEILKIKIKVDIVDFSFSEVILKELDPKIKNKSHNSLPKEFLDSFHYAQFGRSSKVIYGAFLKEKLISVCKFSTPIRKEVATSLNYSYSEVLELDRFCIHPEYQKKNFASWFISKCMKMVFEKYLKINHLVSFADSTYGHSGVIYKAANWKEIGNTKPDYHYINDGGWILHKKTLYNHAVKMGKNEKGYSSEYGYKKVYGKLKTKFIFSRFN